MDDEYQARPKWLGSSQDPGTLQYDSANYTLSPTYFASLRAGTTIGGWQIAAFVNNLFDTHVDTNFNFTIDPGSVPEASRLQRSFTYRPRTFGITFTYRH